MSLKTGWKIYCFDIRASVYVSCERARGRNRLRRVAAENGHRNLHSSSDAISWDSFSLMDSKMLTRARPIRTIREGVMEPDCDLK